MLLGHWVKLEWLELMEMWTRTTRIGFLETLAFPVVPVALAACHLSDARLTLASPYTSREMHRSTRRNLWAF